MQDHGSRLFRVVYASRAVLPVVDQFDATVSEILATARSKNARLGITGLLLAHDGWFLQALEGPRRAVSQVFGDIGRDLRHAQIELLSGGPVETRMFGRWSMCAQTIAPAVRPILQALDLADDFDPFRMEGAKALRLLAAIARAPVEARA